MDKKHEKKQKLNRTITLLFWIYLAVLLRITVFRSGFRLQHLFENGSINLTFFEGYIPLVTQGHWLLFLYLFVGNMIWFVPLGMYLEYKKKHKKLGLILICGFSLSFMIESLQYLFGTGYSELDDLILNTLGTGIGAVFMRGIRRMGKRSD